MKKRKPPVLLITLLVVMVGIVAVYNLMQSGVISPSADAHDHAPPQQSVVTPATERQAMRDAMRRQMTSPPAAGDPSGMPKPKTPTVLVEKQQQFKQKPNESSTSTQWYAPESAKAAESRK